jgi:tetratricopeptide (TPR) repeat protein
MLTFGSVRKAITCAAAIQRALEQLGRGEPAENRLRVRIGINTGEVIREEGRARGEAVHAAARVAAKATGGEILVSEVVKQLAGTIPDLPFKDRGRLRLKGFPERWRLFEVAWRAQRPIPFRLREVTQFVGRQEEKGELLALLERTMAGTGSMVMVGGEAGIGKTRLAEEIASEARRRGATALTGHCYEMEGSPPYIPFLEMTETIARVAPPEVFRQALGEDASEVARLMPELRRMFPDIPEPLRLPPEQERHYIFNGLRDFLKRSSETQPLVLVLDDLHWADESTLLLLAHIARDLHEVAILVLGTYRDVELNTARPLAKTLEDLLRRRLAYRLGLKRFSEEGVATLLCALAQAEPPPVLVKIVYSETEGNPFFVEEVFQHLSEEGKLLDDEGSWRADIAVDELDVPESVRLVIGRRLERLTEHCRRMLSTSAVVGRAFGFRLLEQLGDVAGEELLDAIEEAERAQLVTVSSQGQEPRFTFAHELIRQTLLSEISLPRRQRLHLRVAEAMEEVFAQSIEGYAADLAHHFYQAGGFADATKTLTYLEMAGDRSVTAAAFDEAARHYEEALSLYGGEDQRHLAALLTKVGFAQRGAGNWDQAFDNWNQALGVYEQLGEGESVGRICRAIIDQHVWGGRAAEAIKTAERGLRLLTERDRGRARLQAGASTAFATAGNYETARAAMEEALAIADELGDAHLKAEALSSACVFFWSFFESRSCVETGLKAAEIWRASGRLWNLAGTLSIVEQGLTMMGRFSDAVQVRDEAMPLAERLGHLGATMTSDRTKLMWVQAAGDIDKYEALIPIDIEITGTTILLAQTGVLKGLLHFWRGRWDEALLHFLAAADDELPGTFMGMNRCILLMALATMGESDKARKLIAEGEAQAPPGVPRTSGAWSMVVSTAEALWILGERGGTAALYPLLLEHLSSGTVIRSFDERLIETVAALAAAAGNQWDTAERHFESALQQATEIPIRIEQAETRRYFAEALIARGSDDDLRRAQELATEAIEIYRDVGMPRHEELAKSLLSTESA